MVSLENTKNPKGGFSFESITQANDDYVEPTTSGSAANLLRNEENIPLTVETEPNFKQINTTFLIILQILSVILLEVGVFVIPIVCGKNDENCKEFGGFDVVVFIHGGLWIIKYLFDRCYQYHHMKSRRYGYLDFYRKTRFIRSLPFLLVSASNSMLIFLIKILNKYCPTQCTSQNLTSVNFLQIYVSVETIILLPILIHYLILTIKFNRSRKSPDIIKEMDRPLFLPAQLKDLGYKDSTYISTILEYQADMIRYYQERDEKLTRKLHQLTDKSGPIENIN